MIYSTIAMKNYLFFLFLLAAHFQCQSQQYRLNWQQFEDSINKLEQDSMYSLALQFLETNRKNLKDDWFKLSKEEIYINEKLGNYEANLAIFREAHNKGFFYLIHPNLPKYEEYTDLVGFSEISEKDLELRDSANSKSEMLFDIVYPQNYDKHKEYPVILILHGGGSNLGKVKKHWHSKQLDQQFIKIYLQNYLHYDSKNFGWRSGDEKAFNLLKSNFNEFQKNNQIQEDKIYVAGMSAGGTFAIDIAVRQIIPITGFITFCPGIPQIIGPEHFKEISKPNIAGFMLGGEDDYYLERQRQMMNVFNEIGIPCIHEIIEDMGHEYPENESVWIDKALKILE